MRELIINLAKKCDADIVGFAPASRFAPNDPIFRVFPGTKTVIGMAFRKGSEWSFKAIGKSLHTDSVQDLKTACMRYV
jgi:hypothetical protein